jgi:hypothetical protein
MTNLLHQLYKTKLRLAGLVTAVAGAGLLFIAKAAQADSARHWLVGWPTNEIGTTLLSVGVIAVIFEYYSRQEADALAAERFRSVIRQEAPAIRDVVLDSLAFNPDTLTNVASPETLDRIATNALGLRLGDQALAHDVYTDLRDQVIRAPERWRDVDVSITLTPATGHGSMFAATIRWEYRVVPATRTMRFACTSDQAEYDELLRDPTITGPWYAGRGGPLDAASPEVFELVQFTVNGKPRPIRRTTRQGTQVYAASLGTAAGEGEVIISYTLRALVQRHGHLLYLDLPRPSKGLHVQLHYAGAGIRRVSALDFIASNQRARINHSSNDVPARTIDVSFDGWLFPRSGVVFVWVLEDELEETSF